MSTNTKVVIVIVLLLVGGAGILFFMGQRTIMERSAKETIERPKEIGFKKEDDAALSPTGPVSPFTGLPCTNHNRRPIAVIQASDRQARPTAGFSKAEMVFEIPVFTASVTRLMAVYMCDLPEEVGSLRSLRHDYIPLADGLDAILVHWGGSFFALDKVKQGVIDNMNCNNDGGKSAQQCCFRKEGMDRLEDSGYARPEKLYECAKEFGYRMTTDVRGYGHKSEVQKDQRPQFGALRVAFNPNILMDVDYIYDQETNSYQRYWGGVKDVDRITGVQLAPKNVVVMFAQSEQILLSKDYKALGLQDPWANVPQEKSTGTASISGRYNNMELGDPWYDQKDSGEAYFYMNGTETKGTWKKDRNNQKSPLQFFDLDGKEILFVPGQIWVEVLEPGQTLKWRTGSDAQQAIAELKAANTTTKSLSSVTATAAHSTATATTKSATTK